MPQAFAAILSLGSFKDGYNTAVTTGFTTSNAAIMGTSEPVSNLVELWAWYRNVDASTKAEAKAFMESKVVRSSSVADVVAFQSKYTTLIGNVDDTNAVAKAVDMRVVLGDTRPAAGNQRDAWDAYQLLDAPHKAAAKEAIILKPFIDGFTTKWNSAMQPGTVATWKLAMKLAEQTMGTAGTGEANGAKTQPFWAALTEADEREVLKKVMFQGTSSVSSKLV